MNSRRAFLMTTISAGAVAVVSLASTLLRRRDSPSGSPAGASQAGGCGPAAENLIRRSEWGAREPEVSEVRRGEHGPYDAVLNPNGWLEYDQPLGDVLKTIVIHHSALPLSDGPAAIQELHMEQRGFADVGYHFMIDEAGRLYEGRALNIRGAHTAGYNTGAVGICLIGNFEEIQPALEQLSMLYSLLSCITTQYTNINRLAGHREFNTGTLCPGANLAPKLPGIAADFGLAFGA